jgi:hypothetical protein
LQAAAPKPFPIGTGVKGGLWGILACEVLYAGYLTEELIAACLEYEEAVKVGRELCRPRPPVPVPPKRPPQNKKKKYRCRTLTEGTCEGVCADPIPNFERWGMIRI